MATPDRLSFDASTQPLDSTAEPWSDSCVTGFNTLVGHAANMPAGQRARSGGIADIDLLRLVASCVRRGQDVQLAMDLDGKSNSLTIWPRKQLFGSDVDLLALSEVETQRLALVSGTQLRPGASDAHRVTHLGTLRRLLWKFAVHGRHSGLLPEISGTRAYRVVSAFDAGDLDLPAIYESLLIHLRAEPVSLDFLDSLSPRKGVAARLLNGLYLQSALMVSRTAVRPPRDLSALLRLWS